MSREQEAVNSLDSAFEWLVLFFSILLGVLFQFLTWIGKQPTKENLGDLPIITKLMASLVTPLVFMIIAWFYQKTTLDEKRKMFLRLFAWNSALITYIYYMVLFMMLFYIGSLTMIPPMIVLIGIMFVMVVVANSISYETIFRLYRAATISLDFWENRRGQILAQISSTMLCFVSIIIFFIEEISRFLF